MFNERLFQAFSNIISIRTLRLLFYSCIVMWKNELLYYCFKRGQEDVASPLPLKRILIGFFTMISFNQNGSHSLIQNITKNKVIDFVIRDIKAKSLVAP